MAGKDNNTYKDIHNEFSKVLQEVYLNDVLKDIEEPNIDLSFLADNKKKRKHRKLFRIASVAAVVIMALLGTNIALLSSESINSYGDKGILHRLYISVTGIFTDESDEQIDDIESSLEVFSENDFEKAKKYLPQLYIPEYIPKGYQLDKLYIEKYNSSDAISTYTYLSDGGDSIEISCMYCTIDKYDYEYQGAGEVIELDDRIIYVEWDDVQEEYYLTIYTETCMINIFMENCNDKALIIPIGKGMAK